MGAAIGFVTFMGITSGYLISTTAPGSSEILRPQGLTFFAFLGGLLSKIFVTKLKEVFKSLLGGHDGEEKPAQNP